MGINSTKEIKKARLIGLTWQFITLGCSLAIGIIGIAYFMQTLPASELVFVLMVQKLFNPFTAGLVLCAIIAAGLTTIDTQILVSGSTFANDIYKAFLNPKAPNSVLLRVSKLSILIIPCISFAIAFNKSSSVYGLVEYAWSGLGCSFGPAIVTSLYSNKTTATGTLLGMLTGATIAAVWPLANSELPAMIPGFFGGIGVILLLTKTK
jgi:sodium/proline symporter